MHPMREERLDVARCGVRGSGRCILLVLASAADEDHGAYTSAPVYGLAYFSQHRRHGCVGS